MRSMFSVITFTGLAASVAACRSPVASQGPEPDAPVKIDRPEGLAECLAAQCAGASDLKACEDQKCARTEPAWKVFPTKVRYDGEMMHIDAEVVHQPGTWGPVTDERRAEAYVGCTVVTAEGKEIDLAVTTLFPGEFSRRLSVTADVGAGVQDVLFGVWDKKIEPCDSERTGCQAFGFLLDGNLATYPESMYSTGMRQRILPEQVSVSVMDAGAGEDYAGGSQRALDELARLIEPWGSQIGTVRRGVATVASKQTEIQVRHSHDRYVGTQLLSAIAPNSEAVVAEEAASNTDFVIQLGGRPESHVASITQCGKEKDDAFLQCMQGQ